MLNTKREFPPKSLSRAMGEMPGSSGCSVDEEKYDALYTLVPRLCRSFDDQSFVRAE